MAAHWYVVQTKPLAEAHVCEGIDALGIRTVFPTYPRQVRDRTRNGRPMTTIRAPLLPGYVFSEFDADEDEKWPGILHVRGATQLLGFSADRQRPSPIRDDFVERVQLEAMALNGAAHANAAVKFEPIAKGVRVTITEGPFAFYGGLVEMSPRDRVRIMLDAVGRPVIEVPRTAVEIA